MAIRKFRKHMKPVIWFLTILFIVSGVTLTILNFRGSSSRIGTYAFKLDGKKVQRMEFERMRSKTAQEYSQYLGANLDRDMVDVLAFDKFIDRMLTLKIGDELHVSVPNSEVDAQYKAEEKMFDNKENFRRALSNMGHTKATLKASIKEELMFRKTLEKITETIKPTDADIEKFYNENKNTIFNGQDFETVKDSVRYILVQTEAQEKYMTLLAKKKAEAKLENLDEAYAKLEPKVEFEKDGYKVTNVDITKRAMANMAAGQEKETAIEAARLYYEKAIDFVLKAKAEGIEVDSSLPLDYQVIKCQAKLYTKLRNEIKPDEKELKAFFKENSIRYDIFPSAKADVAVIKIEPSEADKAAAKAKAEKILKEVTKDNFADKAREYSNGPSAPNGGQLGWFAKGDMIAPFDKAVFEGKSGEIYPEPVETTFGYHIIYVEDRDDKSGRAKASHILIIPQVSEKTLKEKALSLEQLKSKLASGELTFEDAGTNRTDIVTSGVFDINKAGYIAGLGYNEALSEAIFKAPMDKVEVFEEKGSQLFIFKKIEEVKYKKAVFDEVKDRVIEDYKSAKAMEEIQQYAI